MTPSLQAFIEQNRHRVDLELNHRLTGTTRTGASEPLLAAMEYSLLDGGKRIRPVLAYASATAAGGITAVTDRVACAVECIHAYSLIHDDLPAMDDDDLRRGKPTCHIAFDEATAILAGDALQTLAFEILVDFIGTDADSRVCLSLVRELSRASGVRGMVGGQSLDLAAVSQPLSLEQLEQMHRHKTGALIEASVTMGAISAGMTAPAELEALRNYARAIGLAFQVQDDILDVVAATDVLGKRQGADQERNKPTYVTLLGLENAKAKALDLHDEAVASLQIFDVKANYLRDIAAYIVERGS